MKEAPRRAKKAAKPARRAGKPAKAPRPAKAGKAKAVRKPAGRKPAGTKRVSRAATPVVRKTVNTAVQKPVQKKVEARPEVKTPAVEKRPFWGFLGLGKKQKAKVSIMDLQGKK